MAADTEDKSAREASNNDVKQSFAWGQLFVGSILAGFSIYQLALKAMSMPPSEMLAGLVATYEAVRDFLMLPFVWMELDLTVPEKNLLTGCIVLLGALIRVSTRFRAYPTYIFWFGVPIGTLLVYLKPIGSSDVRDIVLHAALIAIGTAFATPLLFLLIDRAGLWRVMGSRFALAFAPFAVMNAFMLLCVLASFSVGAVLLLLNWATS